MAGAAVSVSTGAMNSLLWKLTALLDAEDAKPRLKGTLRKELSLLDDELNTMKGLLQSFAKREESTAQLKQWMRQVREMVYDIEDWIDERWRPHRSEADHKNLRGSMRGRMLKFVMKLTAGSDEGASDQIRAFKERIKEANDRQKRYQLERTTSSELIDTAADLVSGDGSANNSRPRAHCEGETSPVGIQDQTGKLVNQLRGTEPKLMVVSLVGFGGLGKTTLAKQVYRKLQEQFGCRAFVCAGRNTSVKAVLMKIRNQVSRQPYAGVEPLNEQQLIQDLEQFLKDKKYFIVVDDLWSSTAWQVIKCALPDNGHGSRIMITTRVRDVAASSRIYESDLVHYVEPLSAADSITLFNSKFDSGGSCPAQETVDVGVKVSERCGGVPLAIITMAGLLASKPAGKQLQTAILSTQEHLDADGMRKVLYLSYSDLSHHLKTCLLYMGVFPEAYKIRKDRLIRRWIAEGFVCERGRESLEDIGEGYLNDLIDRNLVQQVPIDDDDDDQEEGYMVHDMVREFIISLSVEENFVTVPAQWINLIPHDKIRRLSLQYSNQEVAPALPSGTVLSHVRSLTIFGRDEEKSDLSKFPSLRVVDLQDTDKLENDDVKSIAKLYQLRYLGLGGKGISTLPEQIGELQNMETLDLRQTDVRELPASLTRLTKLMHLLVTNARLPAGLGDMEHLQELSTVSVSKTSFPEPAHVEELKKLKKLRTLGLNWCVADDDSNLEDYRKSLVSTLNDLGDSSLQCITLDTDNGKNKLDFLLDSWKPPYSLQKFKLRRSDFYFSRVPLPAKMEGHIKLTYLEIGITQVRNDDLTLLSHLPALIVLKLRSSGASSKESFKISSVGFRLLQQFWFMRRDKGIDGVVFDEGAMPKLRMLRLHCNLHGAKSLPAGFNFGMRRLKCLKQVRVKIDCDGAKVAEVVAAEAAIRDATDVPSTCELEFII